MNIRFYFDPICPWCWVTSFWLDEEVRPRRDLQIDWRPISLMLRNDIDVDDESDRSAPLRHTHKLLRIVSALRDDGQEEAVRAVYRAFGVRIHHGDDAMDVDVAAALVDAGVDPAFAQAYDDPRWDDAVAAYTAEAEAVAGDDVGTPIVAFDVNGTWKGYFGPVIPAVVQGDAAVKLFNGLVALVETDGFFELKRTRDVDLDLSTIAVGD